MSFVDMVQISVKRRLFNSSKKKKKIDTLLWCKGDNTLGYAGIVVIKPDTVIYPFVL